MIPLSEAHLRAILREWVAHYNTVRVHSRLGPGVPDPPRSTVAPAKSGSRHRLAANALVRSKSILNGLHHEYWLATCYERPIAGAQTTAMGIQLLFLRMTIPFLAFRATP